MSLFNKHKKNNKPKEHFVNLINEYYIYQAVVFGGVWYATSSPGSRASSWNSAPSSSIRDLSVRHVCNHRIAK